RDTRAACLHGDLLLDDSGHAASPVSDTHSIGTPWVVLGSVHAWAPSRSSTRTPACSSLQRAVGVGDLECM
ncbi:MAG: hypothetical protein ABW033_04350, partial [Acidimicrobiia bacterium]